MILNTKEKEISLVPTTRKIVNITDKYKGSNLNELYFKAFNDGNLKVFANIILELVEDKKVFNADIDQVYDFIDLWKKENNKSYTDLFKEVAEMINEEGFFVKKMTEEELKETMDNPLTGFNFNEVVKSSTEKIISEVVAEEFKGYQA